MNKLTVAVLALFPAVSFGQGVRIDESGTATGFLVSIVVFINDILIPFIIGIGFLFFVWGIFLYFILGGADEEKRVKGRSLMVWATVGFVTIIIFFGVINLLSSAVGLEGETLKNIPQVPTP